jgi:hypothetical protein
MARPRYSLVEICPVEPIRKCGPYVDRRSQCSHCYSIHQAPLLSFWFFVPQACRSPRTTWAPTSIPAGRSNGQRNGNFGRWRGLHRMKASSWAPKAPSASCSTRPPSKLPPKATTKPTICSAPPAPCPSSMASSPSTKKARTPRTTRAKKKLPLVTQGEALKLKRLEPEAPATAATCRSGARRSRRDYTKI